MKLTLLRVLTLSLLALALALPALSQTKTRIFVGKLEYTGPSQTVDGVTYVDLARFAKAVGWAVKTSDQGTGIAARAAEMSDPKNAVEVNGTAFTGATRSVDGQVYVSVTDLAAALHGSTRTSAQYHTLSADIPDMPTAEAANPVVRKMVEVDQSKVAGYRLVEFYATW